MLSKDDILDRLVKQWTNPSLDHAFIKDRLSHYPIGSHTLTKLLVDIVVSQKIMYHLKEFFLLTTKEKKSKTKKIVVQLGRFTRKLRTNGR
jgi:hypothetical protein